MSRLLRRSFQRRNKSDSSSKQFLHHGLLEGAGFLPLLLQPRQLGIHVRQHLGDGGLFDPCRNRKNYSRENPPIGQSTRSVAGFGNDLPPHGSGPKAICLERVEQPVVFRAPTKDKTTENRSIWFIENHRGRPDLFGCFRSSGEKNVALLHVEILDLLARQRDATLQLGTKNGGMPEHIHVVHNGRAEAEELFGFV